LSSDSEENQLEKAEEVEKTLNEVLEGEMHCFILIPSWGAQFVALAQKAEWQ